MKPRHNLAMVISSYRLFVQIEGEPCTVLKIALVTETYRPEINGVAMTLGNLVDKMKSSGYRVQVVRPRQHRQDVGNCDEVTVAGIPIPRYTDLRAGLPAGRTLRRVWGVPDDRPDLVHIATEGPLGWSALRAAQRLSIPTTSSFHTNFHAYGKHYGYGLLQRPALAYLRWFHNRTAATFAPTAEICESLERAGFKRMRVMSRGVDLELFNPERRSLDLRRQWTGGTDSPIVIYVGRVAAEKNLDLAITTFRSMEAMNPKCRMVIVGDGPLRKRLQNDNPDIIFAGSQRGIDLATHYASADIFLFPSLTETFGNVVTEAMASGLAVVAFDYAAARQYIERGYNGIRVPVDNTAAFTAAALSLVNQGGQVSSSPNDLSLMRAAARVTAATLSWDTVTAHFLQQLHTIVGGLIVDAATAPA